MNYYQAFFASMFYVFLRSAQQLNVTYERYWWILPTSLLMGVFDVFIIVQIAKNGYGWELVATIGTGSGIGATVATKLHNMARGKKHGVVK